MRSQHALIALLAAAACTPTVEPAPVLDFSGPPDLAMTPPFHVPAGCFALLNGAFALNAPQRSLDLLQAFTECELMVCGVPGVASGKPCGDPADGGVSTPCRRCFANVSVNDAFTLVDSMQNPLVCVDPNTGSPDDAGYGCRACAQEMVACRFDCNTDLDCQGLQGGPHCGANNVCVF